MPPRINPLPMLLFPITKNPIKIAKTPKSPKVIKETI